MGKTSLVTLWRSIRSGGSGRKGSDRGVLILAGDAGSQVLDYGWIRVGGNSSRWEGGRVRAGNGSAIAQWRLCGGGHTDHCARGYRYRAGRGCDLEQSAAHAFSAAATSRPALGREQCWFSSSCLSLSSFPFWERSFAEGEGDPEEDRDSCRDFCGPCCSATWADGEVGTEAADSVVLAVGVEVADLVAVGLVDLGAEARVAAERAAVGSGEREALNGSGKTG